MEKLSAVVLQGSDTLIAELFEKKGDELIYQETVAIKFRRVMSLTGNRSWDNYEIANDDLYIRPIATIHVAQLAPGESADYHFIRTLSIRG